MHRTRNAAIVALFCTIALTFSTPSHADCAPDAKAAATGFMNAYVKQALAIEHREATMGMDAWLHKNQKLTAYFKDAYQTLQDDARRKNPESGLGFDPIVNAQDFPDHGFEPERCKKSGFVVLRGVDWPTFKVTVKVVKTPTTWMVDGAGVINIPEDEQPHTD